LAGDRQRAYAGPLSGSIGGLGLPAAGAGGAVKHQCGREGDKANDAAKQAEIYQAASDAKNAIKAIVYFTAAKLDRVKGILKRLGLGRNEDVVLIDARRDNKPSASKAGLCCKDDRRRWEDGDKLDLISFMRRYRKER
jgi:hypothetical protein